MTKTEVRRAIGYSRVSTDAERQGAGLTAQRRAIQRYAAPRGWVIEIVSDEASGSTADRPALKDALGKLARHEADALIVSKLDRLSRSLVDFADIVRLAERQGWVLVVLDPELDMSAPSGRAMAGMLTVFAEFERSMIRERIKWALAVKRSQGVKLGRPRRRIDPERLATVAGLPEREAARRLGIPRSTLQRWLAQKPAESDS